MKRSAPFHHLARWAFSAALLLGCISCTATNKRYYQKMHSISTQAQRIAGELDDLRYHLNNYNVELDILEGKISGQQNTITKLNQKVATLSPGASKDFQEELFLLEKQISALNDSFTLLSENLATLRSSVETSGEKIAQHEGKLHNLHNTISQQNRRLDNLADSLNLISEMLGKKVPSSATTYKVKKGDTLEKIARRHNTTIEALREANDLSGDLIFVGQDLYLP